MTPEIKNCQNCHNNFTIDERDLGFYEKFKVPPPTWCPECRLVRRLMSRNERGLFKRKCDMCGQDKILSYRANSPYKVYCYQCWFSDKWDGIIYERNYDFGRNFFEQYKELFDSVPRMGIIQQGMQSNSEYTNRASDNKNCYMIFAANRNENCYYGTSYWDSKDSMDCYNVHRSEMCYEVIDSWNCNNLKFSQECNSCSNSAFLYNCRNCESCFGCVNIRNKGYCIFNEQYSKEEYEQRVKKFDLTSSITIKGLGEKLEEMKKRSIVPWMMEYHSTEVTGNWIEECKNTKDSYNCDKVEDGRYLFGIMEGKDVMDHTYWSMGSELMYECSNIGRQCASVMFSHECWDQLLRAQYCINCHNSSDLFGCVGLRSKQYCILNKQYTKEEYEVLVPKMIEHMNLMPFTDEKGRVFRYGERFPLNVLPFAYNETIAQEYFPITKEKAEEMGYRWVESDQRNYQITLAAKNVPDSIDFVSDPITQEVIGCAHEGKCNHMCVTAFKINPYDLAYYKRMQVPPPTLCPNCRHFERLAKRTPYHLWKRTCQCTGVGSENGAYKNTGEHAHGTGHCLNEFETSYAPERPETVYCQDCYQKEVV